MEKIKPLKFNQESYDTHDSMGKKILSDYLESIGYQILSSVEDYGHDIIAQKPGEEPKYFEVEIKNSYPFTSKESFKFNTVSFLGRKMRLHNIKPFIYVIVCSYTGYAICLESDRIFLDKYIEKIHINTNMRQGLDTMFRVPKNLCKFFKISI